MSLDYAALAARAEALLSRFGAASTLRKSLATGGTPWNPEPGAVHHDIAVSAVETSNRRAEADSGTRAKRTLLVAGATPDVGDRIAFGLSAAEAEARAATGAAAWARIQSVTPIQPAGVALLHEVELEI